jgi:hypothetical protein
VCANSNNSVSLWDKDEQSSRDVTVIHTEAVTDDNRVSGSHQSDVNDNDIETSEESRVADMNANVGVDGVDCADVDLLDAVEKLCAELNEVVSDRDVGGLECESSDVRRDENPPIYHAISASDDVVTDDNSSLGNSSAVGNEASDVSRALSECDAAATAAFSSEHTAVSGVSVSLSVVAPESKVESSASTADIEKMTSDCTSMTDPSDDVHSADRTTSKQPTKPGDGRINVVTAIPTVSVVKYRPVATKEFFNISSSVKLTHGVIERTHEPQSRGSSPPDVRCQTEDANHNMLGHKDASDSSGGIPPPMAAPSCMTVKRQQQSPVELVTSRNPLNQLYGGVAPDNTANASQTSISAAVTGSSASSIRKSLSLRHGPLSPSSAQSTSCVTGGGPSEILSNIRLARSCSRNSFADRLSARGGNMDDMTRRQRLENFRGGVVSMLAADSRSTPWLPTAGDSSSSLNLPSQPLNAAHQHQPHHLHHHQGSLLSRTSPLRMTMSTTGLQFMSPSVTPTSSLTSSPCQTPTASRCSSSILSNDGSTLHASSILNEDDCTFILFVTCLFWNVHHAPF